MLQKPGPRRLLLALSFAFLGACENANLDVDDDMLDAEPSPDDDAGAADAGEFRSQIAPNGGTKASALPAAGPTLGRFDFELAATVDNSLFRIQTGSTTHGSTFLIDPSTPGSSGGLTIQGLASGSSTVQTPISLEYYDPFNFVWTPIVSMLTSTTNTPVGGQAGYRWGLSILNPAVWQFGGVLRLRAIPQIDPTKWNSQGFPRTFDIDGKQCLVGQSSSATWSTRSANCATPFPTLDGGGPMITVVSTDVLPVIEPLEKPVGSFADKTTAYYTAIAAPATLGAFRTKYGFPGTEVTRTYFNDGDLGLAREMHCKTFVESSPYSGTGLACYVTNYAPKDGNGKVIFGDYAASMLLAAQGVTKSIATVAMVKHGTSTNAALNRMVDFIVYDGNQARSNKAPLDSTAHNDKVPNNCLSCHGIASKDYLDNVTATPRVAPTVMPSFLAWDPDPKNLLFGQGTNPPNPNPTATDFTKIRDLNRLVYNFAVPAPGVTALIEEMYAGNPNNSGATYVSKHVSAGWSKNFQGTPASDKLYKEVLSSKCITCHSTGLPAPDLNSNAYGTTGGGLFASFANFEVNAASVINDVCSSHVMPQAERTQQKFWKGPDRAYLLSALESLDDCNP